MTSVIEPGQAYQLPDGAVVLVTAPNRDADCAGEWLVVDVVNVLPYHVQGDVKTYHADDLTRGVRVQLAVATVREERL